VCTAGVHGLAEIDSMKYWIEQLSNRDKNTVEGYKVYLLKFCDWVGKSPDELIEMKKQALEHNGDRRENMVLESKVKLFMNYLKNEAIWYADHRKVKNKVKKKDWLWAWNPEDRVC